jgi:hypothetical protein
MPWSVAGVHIALDALDHMAQWLLIAIITAVVGSG